MARRRKNYNKVQPQLKPLPFIIIGAIIVGIIVVALLLRQTPKEKFYKSYTSLGAKLEKNHSFKEISLKEMKAKIEKNEPVLMYFGSINCQHCINEVGYYDQYFKELDIKETLKVIYYVDASKILKQTDLIDYFKANLIVDLSTSPQLILFDKGVVIIKRADYKQDDVQTQGQIYNFYKGVANHIK